MKPRYGSFQAEFFYVGFVKIHGRFVHVGFYRSLRDFEKYLKKRYGDVEHDREEFREFVEDLEKYFSGKKIKFDYPVELSGTTFQLKVWRKVMEIPYGETRSYRWVAESIGRPRAARPVANAVKNNSVALIVPCHRVIRSDGRIAGSGFGKKVREYLLRLEKAIT